MKNSALTKKIYRKKTIEKAKKKTKLLGESVSYDAYTLLNIRFFCTGIIVILFLLFSKKGYILAPLFGISFYFLSEYILIDLSIKKRERKLENEAIFFFEVLLLTLDSGTNLKQAIEITSRNVDSDLSKEFRVCLEEAKLGKSFTESLKSLKERIPSDTINNAILNITEASSLGSNIKASLENNLSYLREKQILEVKAEITKLPTKISVVSVIFFIPIMLLVILAPVLIEFLLT